LQREPGGAAAASVQVMPDGLPESGALPGSGRPF